MKADFIITTEQPKATVVLGLQGGQLADEGELDKQAPWLDVTEDGYVVNCVLDAGYESMRSGKWVHVSY